MGEDRRGFLKRLLGLGAASVGLLGGGKVLAQAPAPPPPAPVAPVRQAYMLNLFPVAGFQYYRGPELAGKMKEGDQLDMVMEPENPYDSFAVRLEWNGEKIGYVPRTENGNLNSLLQQDAPLYAFIHKVRPGADPWEAVLVEVLMV